MGSDVADRSSGESLYLAARNAAQAGQPEVALGWLDKARAAFLAEGAPLLSLRTDLGRINVLDDLARTTESLAVAENLERKLRSIEASSLAPEDAALHAWLCAAAAENLGASLGLVGRHGQAVEVHEHARTIYETAGSDIDVARATANLGVDLIHIGNPLDGLQALEAARPVFVTNSDRSLANRCLMYQARALALTGDYGKAVARLDAVQSVRVDDANADAGVDALRGELVRAGVFETLNLFPETLELCAKLETTFENRNMTRDLATCRHVEARTLLGMGRPSDALPLARDCVELFEAILLPIKAAAARVTVARCLGAPHGCDEIDLALGVLRSSEESRSIIDAALTGAELSLSPDGRSRYLDEAEQAGALRSPETRWRAQWLRSKDEDHESRIVLLDSSLACLGEIHKTLKTDYLRAPFMANRREPLEARVSCHLLEADDDMAFQLSARYRSMALRGDSAQAPASLIPADTTLLYQSIGSRLVCFVARPDGDATSVETVDLGHVAHEVLDLLEKLDAEWRHLVNPVMRRHTAVLQDSTERILQRLYGMILAPVEERLQPGPITIVPTGHLATVPFAGLFDGSTHLLDRRAISISPGVCPHQPMAAPATNRTLVIGLPDRLAPSISNEVAEVAEITNGRMLVEGEAHTDAVKLAIAEADTVHLATHSVFRSDNPWLSWMRFADRDVTAAELATWDLRDRTLVLAACSSGRQLGLGEDEMLGFPRAALLAGASAVIVNQWIVDDVASVGLMSQLHIGLRTLTPAEALRRAQVACRDASPHPYFWAAPMLYVNPQA